MSVSTSGTGSRIVGQHGEMSYDLIGRLTCWPGTDLEQNRDTTWKGDGRELATLDVAVAPYATYISAPSRWFQALTAAKSALRDVVVVGAKRRVLTGAAVSARLR
uniref:Uncharacterized protein n=1 Tax=Bionectria ochroleuca TaxID=29856 RepID=A0A0B7JI02_BIOOC